MLLKTAMSVFLFAAKRSAVFRIRLYPLVYTKPPCRIGKMQQGGIYAGISRNQLSSLRFLEIAPAETAMVSAPTVIAETIITD